MNISLFLQQVRELYKEHGDGPITIVTEGGKKFKSFSFVWRIDENNNLAIKLIADE
jgi:hypothetical protein